MLRCGRLTAVVICLVAVPAFGEGEFFLDGFDSYAAGSTLAGQGGWETWGGNPGADARVVATYAYSPPHSLEVSSTAELVHQFSGVFAGTWWAKVLTFIPGDQTGDLVLSLLNRYDGGACVGTGCNWSVSVSLCRSGCVLPGSSPGTVTNLGGSDVAGAASAPLITDAWVEVAVEFDPSGNWYNLYYDGVLLETLAWTVTGDAEAVAIAFQSFGSTATYVDDVLVDHFIPVELQRLVIE